MGLISVQWVLVGYTFAFGPSIWGLIGNLSFSGLTGVGSSPNPDYAPTIPHLAYAAYQMMFAVITPALITGAFVERVRFKAFLVFAVLWANCVYDPVAHWVWSSGGFLRQLGALDFAGGTVVHVTAGFSALAFATVIGARRGFGKAPIEPHNIPYSILGAGLLWMGWFGFNGGSALGANGLAVNAVVTTNTAIQINIIPSEHNVEKTVETICLAAHSGRNGDVMIFIYPVEDVIRIRTGERGHEAIMYPGDIDERRESGSGSAEAELGSAESRAIC